MSSPQGPVFRLSGARRDEACDALALAFRDNPLNVAVIGGDASRRLRSNRAGIRLLLPVALRHALVLAAGRERIEGCLLAAPPWRYPLPAPSLGAQLLAAVRQGFGVRGRWARVFEHLDALHPPPPHWYLSTVGVVPEARGRGVGLALVAALLEQVDADACPCYLETDRAENLPFYARSGFVVARESQVFGVRLWHLWRDAR